MSILAELARAERIRAKSLYNVAHQIPKQSEGLAMVHHIIRSLAIASDHAASEMEAEVKAEFARELQDGTV